MFADDENAVVPLGTTDGDPDVDNSPDATVGVTLAESDRDGRSEAVEVTLCDADCNPEITVRDNVGESDADRAAEHESGAARPVAAHPQAQGMGAADARGQ